METTESVLKCRGYKPNENKGVTRSYISEQYVLGSGKVLTCLGEVRHWYRADTVATVEIFVLN